ncbi:dihydroneopterin aldolase [Planktotalea sp.]|uniref:dihydroneopterin aldolase n=1 Tax=Planktotalea sp. TaxID=2029877 RepID=UPI0025F1795A|nr:dihydroneopterin aldolase [Planktotalea sp.]
MIDEINQAFAHPLERSKVSGDGALLDRISLRDHVVAVEIGAFQAERDMTQRISFNIVVEVRHASKELDDDVDLILSYDSVTEAIDIELAAERLNLLETLAERVADRILTEPQAIRVFVRIEKLDRGGGALGVEIVRTLDDVAVPLKDKKGIERARVAALSQDAMKSAHLSGWIDQLSALSAPLILCVPAAVQKPVCDPGSLAHAHVELLSIEQNAWALVAREPRCAVVGTRTELDWATKNNQISIWAPSKFVMDAVESPIALVGDPLALADWFAGQINALELLTIGGSFTRISTISNRTHAADQAKIGDYGLL